MGIKDFTKVFKYKQQITYAKLKSELGINLIAIDAMNLIHRASTWQSAAGFTDKDGNPTSHIMVIMSTIKKFKKLGIDTIWCFDHEKDGKEPHLQLKEKEIQKRKATREKAKIALKDLKEKKESLTAALISQKQQPKKSDKEELFSDESDTETKIDQLKTVESNIASKTRQVFSIQKTTITDIKFILDCLDIPWVDAPAEFEGEQIAAYLTIIDQANAVLSDDTDCLLYGAKILLKHATKPKKEATKPKKEHKMDFDVYVLADVLEKNNITINDLIKIGVILGCDLADKTPKVGPKTVLNKFREIQLTDEQKKAEVHFKSMGQHIYLDVHNRASTNTEEYDALSEMSGLENLKGWLTSKGFSKKFTL